MRWSWLIAVCCVAASVARADAPVRFEDCQTLEQCLLALDGEARGRSFGAGSDSDRTYAARLERFGDSAKQALLARASGSDRHWANLAGSILMYWTAFDGSDVPALIAGLHAEPGGWVAWLLGRIGTAEALQALTDDVRAHGAASQSGYALAKAGPRALPYVLSLLDDEKHVVDAGSILHDMKDDAVVGLDGWLAIASDAKAPEPKRLAALRGIGVLGTRAKRVAPRLRALWKQAPYDEALSDLVGKVLAAMGDDSTVGFVIDCGHPAGQGLFDAEDCLARASVHGRAALPYANWILVNFTMSERALDRAAGASALGYIGYREGEARLREMLRDPDWHVVYAAVRALGWLGAKDALGDIETVAATHWLEAVRGEARTVADALRSGALPRPKISEGSLNWPPRVEEFSVDATNAPDVAPCASERWRWNGREFGDPGAPRMALNVPAPRGTLTGSDHGEFGGELVWQQAGGEKSLLMQGNIEGIEALPSGGAVVAFGGGGAFKTYDISRMPPAVSPDGRQVETVVVDNGPAGSGWAMLARADAGGAWRFSQLAVFPRAVDALTAIGSGVYAAWSGNRAVVFTVQGIQGIAACVAK